MLEHVETHNIISFYSAPDLTRLCSRKASDASNWKPRKCFLGVLSGFKSQKFNISVEELNFQQRETLATLAFKYTKKELDSYLAWRTTGLTHKSGIWIKKSAEVFWSHTKGTISKANLEQLRTFLFRKYR